MEVISEEIAEKTWQEVGGFSPNRAKKEMINLGEQQPDLLSFMLEFTQELDPEVHQLAIYIFFVVCRMFEKASAKKIKKISSQQIIERFESSEKFISSLEGTHEKFFERIAKKQISVQPFVMKYVLDTLFEAPEDEDPIKLTEDDVGYLFLIFKTVVDVLHEAA